MENIVKNNNHALRYENEKIFMTGVAGVDNFDASSMEVRLFSSSLLMKGQGFFIEEMDVERGILTVKGRINSLNYHNKLEKTSFVKKLFK
jgi:sporulation protein YabP